MKVQLRDVGSIKPYRGNPRQNDEAVDAVARSIKEFGARVAIVVDKKGVIVKGHTTHRAAIKLGMKKYPVHVATDLTPAQAKAYRIADNRTGEIATWDRALLRTELVQLRDVGSVKLDALGWSPKDLEILIDGPRPEPSEVETPALLPKPVSVKGDVWICGRSRLLCGDSTKKADVQLVVGGIVLTACVTDPPYGIDHEGITNDAPEQIVALYRGVLEAFPIKDGLIAAFHSPRMFPVWLDAIREHGQHFERMLWLYRKGHTNANPWRSWIMLSDPILLSSVGEAVWPTPTKWSHDTYMKIDHEDVPNDAHTTIKPISIVADLIEKLATGGVYEPFSGSGTTLLACEQLGKVCCAIEIDPRYVDAAVRRWQHWSGKDAVLESTGLTWAETAKKRRVEVAEYVPKRLKKKKVKQ